MSEHSTFVGDDRRGAVRYLHAIRQHWVLLLLLVVCSVATTWIFVSTVAKRYQATVDISVTPVTATDDTFQGLSVFRQSLDGSSTVVTAARVFSSPEIRLPAAKAMGPRLADAATITIIPVNQADVVAIRATAHTAKDAALAANIFAATATRTRTKVFQTGVRGQIDRIERQIVAIPSSQRATNLEYTTLAQKVGLLKSYLGIPTRRSTSSRQRLRRTAPPGHAEPGDQRRTPLASLLLGADLPSCSSLPTHGSAVRTSFNSPSAFPYSRAFRACRGEWRTGTFWARASCPGPRGRATGLSVRCSRRQYRPEASRERFSSRARVPATARR